MNFQPLQPFGSLDSDLVFTFKSFGAPEPELAVVDFSVEEATSELPQIHVSLASKAGDLDLTKLVDKPGVLTVHDRYAPQPRFFHGVVAMAERGESGAHFTRYALTLLPALHRLRYGSDCRIFQQTAFASRTSRGNIASSIARPISTSSSVCSPRRGSPTGSSTSTICIASS